MRIAQHLISGGTQTKAPPSIAAHIASNAIDFFRVMKKSQLLPLNAADRAWSNPIGIEKGGEHQSQILSFKRRTTCPLKRGRSNLTRLNHFTSHYSPSVALPTLNPCRYLHESKARFPVGWLFPFPVRDSHPLKTPSFAWRSEDRLHNQLKRTLYDTVADTRDRQGSHLRAALFRYLLLPRPQRHIAALDQFATVSVRENSSTPLFLNGLERDSITSRSPIVTLGHLVRSAQRLASCRRERTDPRNASAVQPSPWRISSVSGLANHQAPLSSRPCLPCCRKNHSQQGRFAPRALPRLIATAGPSDSLSPSVRFPAVPGYTAYLAPPISQRDEEGLSSCSARPCHHAVDNHPAGVSHRLSLIAMVHVAFAITVAGSASRAKSFQATSRSLALRPGDSPSPFR